MLPPPPKKDPKHPSFSVDRPAGAKLVLVDTGEVLTGVDLSDLRLLKQSLMQYPMLAVKMSLSGVEKPDTREWSKEVAAYFNDLSRNPVRISVDNRHVDMACLAAAANGQPAEQRPEAGQQQTAVGEACERRGP